MSAAHAVAQPDLLTDAEREQLAEHGPGVVSWARRVRLEQQALDDLLRGEQTSNVVPFGRRSSAMGVR